MNTLHNLETIRQAQGDDLRQMVRDMLAHGHTTQGEAVRMFDSIRDAERHDEIITEWAI